MFLNERKQTEMQWLQDPDQSYVDNQKNARREASRHFRNIKTEYLTAKIDELEANSKI
jgi:beta-lactamase class D